MDDIFKEWKKHRSSITPPPDFSSKVMSRVRLSEETQTSTMPKQAAPAIRNAGSIFLFFSQNIGDRVLNKLSGMDEKLNHLIYMFFAFAASVLGLSRIYFALGVLVP